jgi:hypothetical protein
MEEGKLFYHYLDEEQVRCEREEDCLGDGPRFRLSIVGEDERIELRNLGLADLKALRDQFDEVIRQYPAPPVDSETADGAAEPSPGPSYASSVPRPNS